MRITTTSITRVVRRLRGGSQSYLVIAEDGNYYVAKFTGNPQGTRTLINEWIGNELLRQLGVSVPIPRILLLTESVLSSTPDMTFHCDSKIAIRAGAHFGSRCPADPEKKAIFDFLPKKFLSRVTNLADFSKALVLDSVLGQTDTRQAIFIRERSRELKFRAYFIDHGMLLGGSTWRIDDRHLAAVYFDRSVYSLGDFNVIVEDTSRKLAYICENTLISITKTIPSEWFSSDDSADFQNLIAQIGRRGSRAVEVMSRYLRSLALVLPSSYVEQFQPNPQFVCPPRDLPPKAAYEYSGNYPE